GRRRGGVSQPVAHHRAAAARTHGFHSCRNAAGAHLEPRGAPAAGDHCRARVDRARIHRTGARMKRSFAAMALSGIATTMLGPLLPGLTARSGWTDAQSGVLFFAQFAASVVLAAAAGPLAVRCGYRPLIAVGLLMIAVACAGCAIAPPAMLALCVALNGCGLGLLIPAANWTAVQMNPGKSAASVMWMNLSWSVGSVVAPLAI